MTRNHSGWLLIVFVLAAQNTAEPADKVLDNLQGEWSVVSLVKHGGKISINKERLEQMNVAIKGDELSIDKYWQLQIKSYDPTTKKAEGYLDGDPGHRFSLVLRPDQTPKEIDLRISGLIPKEREEDLEGLEKYYLENKLFRWRGIYTLDGDTLTICYEERNINELPIRPTNFSGKESEDHVLLVLKRKKSQ